MAVPDLGPDRAANAREIAKFSEGRRELSEVRGDARTRRRGHRADAEHDAAQPANPVIGGCVEALAARPVFPQGSAAAGRGDRSPHRRRPAHPRSLVRVGGAQGHAGDRRDHRRVRRAVDAGHRLRALPSRHGRDQRQTRRLGLRQRRHGRP